MTMSKTIFGIDIGGSTIKCGVFDGESRACYKRGNPHQNTGKWQIYFYMI